MAADNQDSLLAPSKVATGFKFPKNFIVYVFGGLFAALAVVVVVKNLTTSEKPKSTPAAAVEKDVASSPPPISTIDEMAAAQEDDSAKEKAKKAKVDDDTLMRQAQESGTAGQKPLPTPLAGGKGQIAPPGNAPNAANAANDAAAAEAARQNLQREAKSIVYDVGVDAAQAARSGQPNEKDAADEKAKATQESLAKTAQQGLNLAASALGNGGVVQTSATKKDRDWLKEVSSEEPKGVVRALAPAAKYMLTENTVVNAVLMNAVNTDMPGQVSARVTTDVYDSITQTKLLLPRGSILSAPYSSDVRVGQDRIFFSFKRLIMPNGVSANLPGTPGTDASGRSGIEGDVNNHYGQMFWLSTIGAMAAYVSANANSSGSGSVTINTGSSVQGSAAQIFTDMSNAVINRNKNIAPTITIPSGVKINLILGSDMVLPIYQPAGN